MNAAELYAAFEIKPAEYSTQESPFEFARRVISSKPILMEQTGVNYSTGTVNNSAKTENSNNYVMYSY